MIEDKLKNLICRIHNKEMRMVGYVKGFRMWVCDGCEKDKLNKDEVK